MDFHAHLVLKDNSACQFYETLGAKKLDTVDIHIAGRKLAETIYGLEDI